jgi:predicted ABC-type sugar transport system permease subunit
MNSTEVPIAPARTPLAPRLVELLSGDWRYVPILTAIVLIWTLFGVWDPKFLSPRNLSNLSLQSVVTGILALGLVPVLIIRQIDMSVAAVSAVARTITGQMLIVFDAPVWLAIAAGVAFGAAVGFVQGRWITWTKTPGFLVTFGVSRDPGRRSVAAASSDRPDQAVRHGSDVSRRILPNSFLAVALLSMACELLLEADAVLIRCRKLAGDMG